MRFEEVSPEGLEEHLKLYRSEGYELREIKHLNNGKLQVTWRPTCCGGDERQYQ
jgi:hypothetical protein